MAPLVVWLALLLAVSTARAEEADAALDAPPVDTWLDGVVQVITGAAWCSGVVIDADGTVATAYHCVASGRRPEVRTRAGASHRARVVATAPRDDLALLEVSALAGAPMLEVRAAPLAPGETVWALGHPYAPQAETSPLLSGTLAWSASRGVVSAVGQRLVQVDAALNPGNSGGPVVDEQGRVVGIASRRLQADNIAFIAPAAGLLALRQEPRRPLLGGTWGLSLTGTQGMALTDAPSVGLAAELALRDRLLLRGGLSVPISQRWTALALGSSGWIAAEADACARLRAGRGRWSTTLDLGGTVLLREGIEAEVAEDAIHLWSEPTAVLPGGVLSLGFGGSALRVMMVHDGAGWSALVGLDLGYPGVLGVF